MSESTTSGKRRAETPRRGVKGGSRRVRSLAATALWLAAVVCALGLATGALLVALRFNLDNPIVDAVTTFAGRIDLGELKSFDVAKGASESAREDAVVKSVLVNWGIAAVVYLVVGKVLDRLVRPRG